MLMHLSLGIVILTGFVTEATRQKLDDDDSGNFFTNLGSQITNMIKSFLGVHPKRHVQYNQDQQPSSQQTLPNNTRNSTPIIEEQLEENVVQVRALPKIVGPINVDPSRHPADPPGSHEDSDQRPIRIIDYTGKLSYCNNYPADCAYLNCLAENFQHSETATNLKLAGKVLLDGDLRKAVMNDPTISQAACDKVNLGQRGCHMFKQLLGLIDNFDPGSNSVERSDPERHGGRRKRKAKIDHDVSQVSSARNSSNWTRPAGINANVDLGWTGETQSISVEPDGLILNVGSPDSDHVTTMETRSTEMSNGENATQPFLLTIPVGSDSTLATTPTDQSNSDWSKLNGTSHREIPDYSDFYEGGSSVDSGSGGKNETSNGDNTDVRYKPKDCTAIVRNARRGK